MRVLLTGATGMIGLRVLERLALRSDAVRVLALPNTAGRISGIEGVEVVEGDLSDSRVLDKAVQGRQIVYHLAGVTIGAGYRELTDVNVSGTENLLRACAGAGIARFVFASSVAVYAPAPDPSRWPVDESRARRAYGPPNVRNYAQSKIQAEDAVLRYQEEGGFECVILRAAPVYGEEAPRIRRMVERLLRHPWRALTPATREMKMHWVHSLDLAKAVVLAGLRRAAANRIFNIAGPDVFSPATILALAKGWPAEHLYDARLESGGLLKYDISRAIRALGFKPEITLERGLREILASLEADPQPPPSRGNRRESWDLWGTSV